MTMQKIPTLFVRDEADRRYVTDEVTPGCEWVLEGEGTATRKYDGTCLMLDDAGEWWARREVKPGEEAPPLYVAVETDETTGKTVGWEPIASSPFFNHFEEVWHREPVGDYEPGTYELIGPKVNGNPENVAVHTLMRHADAMPFEIPARSLVQHVVKQIRETLGWEGLVFHHPDGRMAKIKARDLR